LNTPLSENRFKKELEYIKKVAQFNGFKTSLIQNMFKKAKKRFDKRSKTTLFGKEENKEWISTTYTNYYKTVQKTFKKNGNKKVSFKTENNLKKKLQNPKDRQLNEDKSGIYQINCNNCTKLYIGQTKRSIRTRFKEHTSNIRLNHPEKSAIANHCITTGHTIRENNLKILKPVSNSYYLNAWETFYINISNEDDLINNEGGPIQGSNLLQGKFIKKLTTRP